MNEQDMDFIRLAIDEARKSKAEDERTHPLVGAVVVKNQEILTKAYRGELASGNHAEFTALELKLPDAVLIGATVYTTLEPCTTRNHPKVPCAQRLKERKVERVVIGMLDPNPEIRGKGILILREANIAVELFPKDLMAEIEELNRDFIRAQSKDNTGNQESPSSLISIVDGEHHAAGEGEVTGLDAQRPVHIRPGTKVTAEGKGNITATRIGYRKEDNK
jgi:pyrimidine deaminase RibD-like protein